MKIAHPWMRQEAMVYLRDLVGMVPDDPGEGGLDFAIDFLFDEAPTPREALGLYLGSEQEVEVMGALVNTLGVVLRKYGTRLSDPDYVETPEWPHVRRLARKALDLLESADAGAPSKD
jgi:hypothetical protein